MAQLVDSEGRAACCRWPPPVAALEGKEGVLLGFSLSGARAIGTHLTSCEHLYSAGELRASSLEQKTLKHL